jgi:hypothetical protein
MNIIKRAIMHFLGVLSSILIMGFPGVAYAHTGFEPKMGYVMLFGFVIGLVLGAACVLCRFWLPKALFQSFAFLFLVLLLGSLFIPKVSLSDIFSGTVLFIITVGIVIPLSLGTVVMNYAVRSIIDFIEKWQRKP